MPSIELTTVIKSDIYTCFDLARSIDLHKLSTQQTNEIAIDGKITGLIEMGEFVTWQATHFGIRQKLSSEITAFERPFHFRDEQLKGIFKHFKHDHFFEEQDGCVHMKDVFEYASPFGFFGKIFNYVLLTRHLRKLLLVRNDMIKEFAESGKGKNLLEQK